MTLYRFGVRDAKIAVWVSANNWGTLVDLLGIRSIEVAIDVQEAELEGDDVVLDTHSKAIKVTGTVEHAALTLDTLAIMTGETVASPTGATELVFGQTDRPYFGLVGKIHGTGDGGDSHILVPKAKLMGPLRWRFQGGQYVTPGFQFTGVYEGAVNGFARLRHNVAADDIELPFPA
jgi:hypothetical protein